MITSRDLTSTPHGASPRAGLARAAANIVAVGAACAILARAVPTVLLPLPVAALLPKPPPVIARTPAPAFPQSVSLVP